MCYLKVFKEIWEWEMYYPKLFKEILGLGEWAPPFFPCPALPPPGGLWGDRLWLDGRETQ
jgi:hypothetical protein